MRTFIAISIIVIIYRLGATYHWKSFNADDKMILFEMLALIMVIIQDIKEILK